MSLLTVPNMTMKGFGLFKAFGHSVYSLSAKGIQGIRQYFVDNVFGKPADGLIDNFPI